MATETRVYRYAGALFVIDERISPESVAIKTQDSNGLVYWVHPDRWQQIVIEQPRVLKRVSRAAKMLDALAHERLAALYQKVGQRPLTADDFAVDHAERITRVE